MPRRLLLDGEDLPALMLRVKAEYGPTARIVKAERVRNGGFAGFFARERYELIVEVPDPPTARDRIRAARARDAASIEDLVDAADAADQAPGTEPEPPPAEPEPFVSTASDTFAQVLASMRDIVGEAPGAAAEPAGAAVEERPPDAPPLMTWPRVPAPVREEVPPAEVAEAAAAAAAVAVAVEPLPEAAASENRGSENRAPEKTAPEQGAPAHPRPALTDDGTPVARLLELGVPVRLLEGFGSLTEPVPLPVLVRRFERPPAALLTPGTLVVVVGDGEDTLRTAAQLAQRARLDPHDVLLAGEIDSVAGHGRRLLTVSAAARVRARLREDAPTIVALGVGDTFSATTAAATLLGALKPDQAWAVLDARLRTGQLRRWLRAVGEHRAFDAVAAVNAFEAQAPGAVLDVGVPVGWVDGLPATAVVWAALLSERLTEDALER